MVEVNVKQTEGKWIGSIGMGQKDTHVNSNQKTAGLDTSIRQSRL